MTTPAPEEMSQLLRDWSKGDQEALNKLMPLVYDELHRLASRSLRREQPGHTLQTTALVHEAYLKLVEQKNTSWQNRIQFFAAAAQVMRHILVDVQEIAEPLSEAETIVGYRWMRQSYLLRKRIPIC